MFLIFPALVILFTNLTNLPAQNVGGSGNHITEAPPVAVNDVRKEIPIRTRADLVPFDIDTEEAIMYVEDLLAGRINSSRDRPESNVETSSEATVPLVPNNENMSTGQEVNNSNAGDMQTEISTAEPLEDSDQPCSDIVSYRTSTTVGGRWYGELLVPTNVTVTGVRIEIILDKPAQSFGAWLGEVTSTDNIRFIIVNSRRRIEPGRPLSVRFFVKYSDKETILPRVKTVILNGRQICTTETGSTPSLPEPLTMTSPTPRSEPVTVETTVTTPTSIGELVTSLTPATTQKTVNIQEPVITISPARSPIRHVPPASPVSSSRPKQHSGSIANGKPANTYVVGQIMRKDFVRHYFPEFNLVTSSLDGVQCGQVDVQLSPFVVYGQYTARGQWPWHAALYKSKGTDLTYMCGGTLIGKKTILTAAHCVGRPYNNRRVDPEKMVVYLGKHNLNLWSEGGVQTKQVREIYVHPDYNSTDFHADIAILELISPAEFTFYVKPVCLWNRNQTELSEVEGLEGVVVGWDYDEKGLISEELMMTKMHVLPQQTCYHQFSRLLSNETFCATFRNGASVCNGDSGGGIVFPKRNRPGSPETWFLRGLISFGTLLEGRRVCGEKYFVVFTDVAKYLDWIQNYQ